MHEQHELKRSLGLVSAISITVGGVIGSGIFLKALDVAKALPDATWIYSTWIVLGVISLFGAFAYAELGTLFPEAGGQYAFLRESWGRFPAFLYGWTFFFAINSGTFAALSAGFADNLAKVVSINDAQRTWVAIAMIVALAIVNHVGVNWGALIQNLATFAKLGALFAIVLAGFFFAGGDAATATRAASVASDVPLTMTGIIAACMAIFWAYEGWYQLPYNAAELRNPTRDLPRGLLLGLGLVIVTYLFVNGVYMHVVPLPEMRALANAVDVPQTVVARAWGVEWASSLAILIAISVLGAANPNMLSSPRAFYAMAKDGLMPRILMRVDPRFRTPTVSIWSQAIWAIGLVLFFKDFRSLTDYVVFASLLFYALTVAGVYVMRRRAPDAPRAYRCWGYPVTPVVFIVVVLFVCVQNFFDAVLREQALYGLAIIAVGVPAWLLTKRGPVTPR